LEGHRSPGWEWHLELIYRNAEILRKNGLSYKQLYDVSASSIFYPAHDIYRIEEEFFPLFNNENNFVPTV
jgi:hypothetical protein